MCFTYVFICSGYLPPEYIEKNVLSNKLDIFSLGVVMLNIITGPRGRSRSAEMSSQEFTDLEIGQSGYKQHGMVPHWKHIANSHGPEFRFVNDHREKPTSYSDEFITPESRLASHLNLSDTQVNQEAYRHNGSSFKEKEEDREVHQIIPMENPDIPIDAHPTEPWILTGNIFGSVDILNCDTQVTTPSGLFYF
uniref:Protein kinase domain-containing protein n=1 Tax=Oryza rufipogon TaxID=4529 RepID=A0A0E0R5U5_ORYRU